MNPASAAGIVQIQDMLQRIINLSVAGAFIALTVVLVYTGIKYLTSGGEPKALQAAQQSFTWALMGMLFLVFAYLALLLINAVTGLKLLDVCLGFPGAPTNCKW